MLRLIGLTVVATALLYALNATGMVELRGNLARMESHTADANIWQNATAWITKTSEKGGLGSAFEGIAPSHGKFTDRVAAKNRG